MIKEEKKGEETNTAPAVVNITQKVFTKTKKPFQEILQELSLILAVGLIIVIFMVYLTEVSFGGDLNIKDLTMQTLMLYTCTVAVHFLLRSYGREKGRTVEQWNKAKEKIHDNARKIIDSQWLTITTEYCKQWEETELKQRIQIILDSVAVSSNKYNTIYKTLTKKELEKRADLTQEQVKGIMKAKRQKRQLYDANFLTSDALTITHSTRSPSALAYTKKAIAFSNIKVLITTALTSIFSCVLVLEVVNNFTFATFLMALLKIIVLIIMGVIGMYNGYKLTSEKEVAEMITKSDEQMRFMEFAKNYVPPVVEEVKAEPVKVEEIQHTAEVEKVDTIEIKNDTIKGEDTTQEQSSQIM